MRAQRSTPVPAPARLQLTVDSIMRGPDLVGLSAVEPALVRRFRAAVFRWRKPGEKEASLYVVARDGGHAERLSDEEAKAAPPANGRWDTRPEAAARHAGRRHRHPRSAPPAARIAVTRTPAPKSSPRWARNDTHVTYVRDGNLFIVPVQPDRARWSRSSPTSARRRAEPRLTDSQKFITRRRREADWLHPRAGGGQAEGRGESQGRKAAGLRAAGSAERRRPDAVARRHARLHPRRGTARRREEHDRAELRDRDRLHRRHSRPHQRRRHAGSPAARDPQPEDRQDRVGRRQLRAAGRRAREACGRRHADGARRHAASRPARGTRDPLVDAGGFGRRQARWSPRRARPTTRTAGW